MQIDSGAIDTVGPKEIAGACKMRETEISKKGVGYVAANGSGIKNHGDEMIAGYTDEGEGISMRVQCADVKKVLCSVHKMNLGGNVVVLDGGRSYMQNKESRQKTKIHRRSVRHVPLAALQGRGGAEGGGESFERTSLRGPSHGE